MTGASLEHDTGLVSLGLHGGKDLPVGVVQIHQDIAGIAAVGIGMEVDVVSLQVPSAQKPYHGPLGQQASGPQPFSRAGDSGAMLNQTHQVEFVGQDRKSTRLNSSHGYISYAVFCLKKKKEDENKLKKIL